MATETLYISGAGDECNITNGNVASCPNHYICVDEESSDGDTTVVWETTAAWLRDLYAVDNHSVGSGTINSVTIYAYLRTSINSANYGKISIKSGGVAANSAAKSLTTSWALYSEQWATNPDGGGAWGSDWSVIDAIQAGVCLYSNAAAKNATNGYCTQVYVVVDYTEAPPVELENKSAGMAAKMVGAGLL